MQAMDAEHIRQSMAAACMQPYSKFMQAKSSPQTEHWHEEALHFRNFDAELVTSEGLHPHTIEAMGNTG